MNLIQSFYNSVLEQIDNTAKYIDLYPGIYKILKHPKRELTVGIPIETDKGEIEVFTARKFSLEHITRDDIASPAKDVAEVSGIHYIMDVDKKEVDTILAS